MSLNQRNTPVEDSWTALQSALGMAPTTCQVPPPAVPFFNADYAYALANQCAANILAASSHAGGYGWGQDAQQSGTWGWENPIAADMSMQAGEGTQPGQG